MKKFMIKTLGCKANYADGQHLEVGLLNEGYASAQSLEDADVVIVNSCTVTDEADKQSQKMARDVLRKNPRAKVIYTGCGAEVNPADTLKMKGLAAVIGNQDKTKAAQLIHGFLSQDGAPIDPENQTPTILGGVTGYQELASRHPMDREWVLPESALDEVASLDQTATTHRTRAFIKIQEGCDSFCTYCIIPYGRGPNRSLSIETIVEQVKSLVHKGIQEVVLTGTNIGDFGMDWAKQLMIDDLIEALLTRTELARLRVSSLDPTEISPRMIALMENYSAFCPHFHVSLQHVSSKILKLMKRKYAFEHVEACLTTLSGIKRKPFVGMDYITGFPGETDQDFLESVERLKALYWNRLHVFPYSERSSTPATKLPGVVPPAVRKNRARILQQLSLERLTSLYAATRQQFVPDASGATGGWIQGVLLESEVKGPDGTRNWISGYAPNYQRVVLPKRSDLVSNRVVKVQVNHWLVDRASGEASWIGTEAQDGS